MSDETRTALEIHPDAFSGKVRPTDQSAKAGRGARPKNASARGTSKPRADSAIPGCVRWSAAIWAMRAGASSRACPRYP